MSRTDTLETAAELLGDRGVQITIRPSSVQDASSYALEWKFLKYDVDEKVWKQLKLCRNTSRSPGIFSGVTSLLHRTMNRILWRIDPRVERKGRINVFQVNGVYIFRDHFAQEQIFTQLERYYNWDAGRFEVPTEGYHYVQKLLHSHCYRLQVISNPERFCVVQPVSAEEPEVLYKASVMKRMEEEYNVYLMKDQFAVKQAVNHGAIRLSDATIDLEL